MSVGLLGLLDDVAGIAKIAAASLDDVIKMSAKAGLKASGAVIDDAAVTPKYVHGFSADREIPIVASIAKGSIKNKLIFLLPAALILSVVLPGTITPLQQATRLQALDQRRDRAGIEEQFLAQRLDRKTVLFPQHEEDQILRICQPKGIQPRLVEAGKGVPCRIDGKAQHRIELERISVFGHGTYRKVVRTKLA